MIDQLKSIGIEKGKPFNPDEQTRQTLVAAAIEARDYLDALYDKGLPPGPILGATMDYSQRWIMDMGIPGPDAGKGGKHLILPPGYDGGVPEDHFVGRSTAYKVVVGLRSLPTNGDVAGAIDRLKTVKVHPLNPRADWSEPTWFDMTPMPQDTTPVKWEDNLERSMT